MIAVVDYPVKKAMAEMSESRRRQLWLLILLIGIGLRLALWAYFGNEPISIWDEQEYNTLAVNLVQHGEYTMLPGGTPSSMRPPLYPALVAAVYSVFGIDNFAAVRAMQAVMGLLTVAVIYALARRIVFPGTALWVAALTCFYPSLVIYNNLVLTETLFTLLLVSSCWLVIIALQDQSVFAMFLAGIALGLAALTRSAVWLAPPFLAVFVGLAWKGTWKPALGAGIAGLAAFYLTIMPWAVRNTRIQETFVAIDVMGGRNFMMGNYQYTPLYRSWDAIALEGEQAWYREIFANYPPEQRRTQGQLDKLALRQGLSFVRAHPGLTGLRSLVKFFDFWGLERELIAGAGRGYFGQMSKAALLLLTVLVAGSYAGAILLAIVGVFLAPPSDRRAHWLFLCVIVFLCAIHTIVFGHSRYHLPLMPLVFFYTVGALTSAGRIWHERRTVRFGLAAACCLLLISGWIWSFVAVDWSRFSAALNSVT